MMNDIVFGVSDFVAVFNQTIEYAYPSINIVGELANFRVSKNRWVYFDLKDEMSSVKFFGTVYQLPGPLEDGLMVQVTGVPRLHPQYGFSISVQNMKPVGEGSIKRASALLEAKLRSEGLFDASRKRLLPYPPARIGLVTSAESAAYHDFIKILQERWGGVEVELADVQVQGEKAPPQLIAALDYFNSHNNPVEVIVITRGGGSAEDLSAFNHEQLTRSVATSRIPTLVAIGHEVDVSLAELAADRRASTPSNAAQILVPDKTNAIADVRASIEVMHNQVLSNILMSKACVYDNVSNIFQALEGSLLMASRDILLLRSEVEAQNPARIFGKGFAQIRNVATNKLSKSVHDIQIGTEIEVRFVDGTATAQIYSKSSVSDL